MDVVALFAEAAGNFQVAFVVVEAALQLGVPALAVAGGLAVPLAGEVGHAAEGGVVAGAEVEAVDLEMAGAGLEAAVGAVAAAAPAVFGGAADLEAADFQGAVLIGDFVDAAAAAVAHGVGGGLAVCGVGVAEDDVGFGQYGAVGGELPVAGVAFDVELPIGDLDAEAAFFGVEAALPGGVVGIALPGGGEGLAVGQEAGKGGLELLEMAAAVAAGGLHPVFLRGKQAGGEAEVSVCAVDEASYLAQGLFLPAVLQTHGAVFQFDAVGQGAVFGLIGGEPGHFPLPVFQPLCADAGALQVQAVEGDVAPQGRPAEGEPCGFGIHGLVAAPGAAQAHLVQHYVRIGKPAAFDLAAVEIQLLALCGKHLVGGLADAGFAEQVAQAE